MVHKYLTYNYPIVIVSVLVAIIASFVTIELMGRVVGSKEKQDRRWILASSVIWGSGIWCMHFTGILAIEADHPFKYDVFITLFSLFLPIAVVYMAFLNILTKQMNKERLLLASLLMGMGIVSMHFIGMHGLNIHIEHRFINILLSIVIAISASFLAIYIFSKVESKRLYIYALPIAAVMGFAISGMHYTSMTPGTRYQFVEHSFFLNTLKLTISSDFLLLSLIIVSVLVIGITYSIFRIENENLLKLKLTELQLATSIQEKSLPQPINDTCIEITSYYKASEELSGDLYYWKKTGENQYSIYIMDVMGHGVSASIISMSIKSYLQGLLEKKTDPASVMTELTKYMDTMFEGSSNPFYFTAIYLLVDTEKGSIQYVNAGHPAGFWKEKGTAPYHISSTCPPIGLLPEAIIVQKEQLISGPGKLLLCTDGFLEGISENYKDQMFEIEKLLQREECSNVQHIKDSLLSICTRPTRYPDDKCLVVIDIKE